LSIAKIKELIRAKGASEVKTCVLLRKPVSKRLVNVEAEYCGFDIPDVFALGCGLDSDGYYRNLPRVCEKIQR
jgi:hypoxanthine phosphoribosyltransferase